MQQPLIVTLDGPAGAGKSTVARQLADHLGFQYLDTGAMYRAVAWAVLQRNIPLENSEEVAALANDLRIAFDCGRVLLNGDDITGDIRTSQVSAAIHPIADNVVIREKMVELQREIAGRGSIVTEGRDQGTVAFPHAQCKFFITASAEERARRRQLELQARGETVSYEEVLEQQIERDQRDAARPVGALRKAEDAIEVCTDGLTEEQVVQRLAALVREKMD